MSSENTVYCIIELCDNNRSSNKFTVVLFGIYKHVKHVDIYKLIRTLGYKANGSSLLVHKDIKNWLRSQKTKNKNSP